MTDNPNKREITEALSQALHDVFGENVDRQRFIDVTRIPLICKSIVDTNDHIKEIKDMMKAGDEERKELRNAMTRLDSKLNGEILKYNDDNGKRLDPIIKDAGKGATAYNALVWIIVTVGGAIIIHALSKLLN